MNIEKSECCYPHGTDAVFTSVPAKLGRQLMEPVPALIRHLRATGSFARHSSDTWRY